MVSNKLKSLTILGAVVGSLLWASTAGAVMVTIGLREDDATGMAPITVVATANDAIAAFNGAFGTFSANNISGAGSPPNVSSDLNAATSMNITNVSGMHFLEVFVTVSNITAPLGNLNFSSSFTSNTLPSGWWVYEQTFLDTANGLFSGNSLAATSFSAIGTTLISILADTGGGPYSVTDKFVISAPTAGTGLSTINLTAVSPVPLPGALPLFASGIVGLWALGRRRKKQTRDSAMA